MDVKRIAGRNFVREFLGQTFDEQKRTLNGCSINNEMFSFCSNPEEYEWRYLDKREMLVPHICGATRSCFELQVTQLKLANSGKIRWESHRVWIVEGTLRRGESNVLARRRFYLDENSWLILLGEGYDRAGIVTKCFMFHIDKNSTACTLGQWYSLGNPEDRSA